MAVRSKRNLGIHLGLFLSEAICISAFYIELRRALSGNSLSWAYVFEWPLFAAYAIYVWRKLLRGEPDVPSAPMDGARREVEDQKLADYNAYLSRVHREKQPPSAG